MDTTTAAAPTTASPDRPDGPDGPTHTTRPPRHLRRRLARVALLAALAVGTLFGAVSAANQPDATAVAPCSAGERPIATNYARAEAPYANFTFLMNSYRPDLVAGGASASFTTCSYGNIIMRWNASLYDNNTLDFYGASMQVLTNRGHVFNSTLQWINAEPLDHPYGREQLHYDVGAGEYPVKVKFIFYARDSLNGGTLYGTYNKTCTVVANGSSSQCSGGQGTGDWRI